MAAMKQDLCGSDIDCFLDWRSVGFEAVHRVLGQVSEWPVEAPEAEYEAMGDIPREIRRNWHPIADQFYLYWRAKRDAAGGAPDRADLDPMLEIPLLCPYICIFEPTSPGGDPEDWFCRLMGTHIDQALGTSLTAHRIKDLYPKPSAAQIRRYGRVVRQQLISHRSGPSRTKVEKRVGCVETLYVPITDKRRGTSAVFGVAVYQWLDG